MVPAKIQALRSERRASAGRPQRWQNLAPGESEASHVAQLRAVRLAPQWLQNRPPADLPQTGQEMVGGVVIAAGS